MPKVRKRDLSHLCRGQCKNADPAKRCRDSGSGSGYICTLPKGHAGPHIACGTVHHSIAHWPNTRA